MLLEGWPVAAAQDVALAYFIAKAIFQQRQGPVGFLLVIAIVSDAIAIACIALWYPANPGNLPLAGRLMALANVGRSAEAQRATPHRFEHIFKYTVQVVLLFYGLVNGGVVIAGEMPGAWAVLLAALVGRPAGILASVGPGDRGGPPPAGPAALARADRGVARRIRRLHIRTVPRRVGHSRGAAAERAAARRVVSRPGNGRA